MSGCSVGSVDCCGNRSANYIIIAAPRRLGAEKTNSISRYSVPPDWRWLSYGGVGGRRQQAAKGERKLSDILLFGASLIYIFLFLYFAAVIIKNHSTDYSIMDLCITIFMYIFDFLMYKMMDYYMILIPRFLNAAIRTQIQIIVVKLLTDDNGAHYISTKRNKEMEKQVKSTLISLILDDMDLITDMNEIGAEDSDAHVHVMNRALDRINELIKMDQKNSDDDATFDLYLDALLKLKEERRQNEKIRRSTYDKTTGQRY